MLDEAESDDRWAEDPWWFCEKAVDAELAWICEAPLICADAELARYSEYYEALQAVSEAARTYAHEIEAPLEGSYPCLRGLLSSGFTALRALYSALCSGLETKEEKAQLRLWVHQENIRDGAKYQRVHHISLSDVETAADEYLRLPYRIPHLERIIIDVMIAHKVYEFSSRTEKPLSNYTKESISQLIYPAAVLALCWVAWKINFVSVGWIVGSGGLFALGLALAILGLPFAWRRSVQSEREIAGLTSIYQELKSDGPISAHHIRRRADVASDKGVVWPPPLFTLLDDMIARTGRF